MVKQATVKRKAYLKIEDCKEIPWALVIKNLSGSYCLKACLGSLRAVIWPMSNVWKLPWDLSCSSQFENCWQQWWPLWQQGQLKTLTTMWECIVTILITIDNSLMTTQVMTLKWPWQPKWWHGDLFDELVRTLKYLMTTSEDIWKSNIAQVRFCLPSTLESKFLGSKSIVLVNRVYSKIN